MGFTKKQRREQKKQQFHQKSQLRKAPTLKTAQHTGERRDRDSLADSDKPGSTSNNAVEHHTETSPMTPLHTTNV